jgi:hypothetical protein
MDILVEPFRSKKIDEKTKSKRRAVIQGHTAVRKVNISSTIHRQAQLTNAMYKINWPVHPTPW